MYGQIHQCGWRTDQTVWLQWLCQFYLIFLSGYQLDFEHEHGHQRSKGLVYGYALIIFLHTESVFFAVHFLWSQGCLAMWDEVDSVLEGSVQNRWLVCQTGTLLGIAWSVDPDSCGIGGWHVWTHQCLCLHWFQYWTWSVSSLSLPQFLLDSLSVEKLQMTIGGGLPSCWGGSWCLMMWILDHHLMLIRLEYHKLRRHIVVPWWALLNHLDLFQ